MRQSFAIGIGGAAGQGVATPGDIFAKTFSRRGLHLNVYNAYQSIIRGGHTFLTIRTGPDKITNMGDRIDLLIPLNQDTMDRHLGLLSSGGAVSTMPTLSSQASRPTEYSCARCPSPSWPTSAATR
jgi:2-oxoglutarate ferredoxin oxidoreductase subunit alpha